MNIELRPRTEPFPVAVPVSANDNAVRCTEAASSRRRAIIYKPAKSAMTSGRAATRRWFLEFEPQSAPFVEPLMGWTGSTDPMAQVRLTFPSCEAAVAYARRQDFDCEVRGLPERVEAHAPADKPQAQPPQLLPINVRRSEANGQPLPGIGATGIVPNLAA